MAADGTVDILGRKPQTIGRAYSSDSFQIAVAGSDDHEFMLVQNLTFNYGQSVTRLFDLENSDFQAYVAARPQGTMSMSNIVTNLDSLLGFLQRYGDVCDATSSKTIVVAIQGRDNNDGLCRVRGGSLELAQPVLVSATMGIAVADYIITNNMSFIFASAKSAGVTGGAPR